MNIRKITMGAALASVTAVAALAHGGATGIVKERMDGMGVMKEAVKLLTPMMQGQVGYDAETVRSQAAKIAAHAGEAMTKLFPENSNAKPSEAKDAIWQDWDSFTGMAEQLLVMADGLAAAADNGLMMSGTGSGGGMGSAGMMGTDTAGMMGTGGGGMMGTGAGMMADTITAAQLAEMPVDGVFAMMGQVCSACHTRFRAE